MLELCDDKLITLRLRLELELRLHVKLSVLICLSDPAVQVTRIDQLLHGV